MRPTTLRRVDAMELQNAIVAALIRQVPDGWERIVVNYEMLHEEGGLVEDRLGFYISLDAQQVLTENSLEFSPELKQLFRTLNEAMLRTGGERWGPAT